jgi:hypothetical protein
VRAGAWDQGFHRGAQGEMLPADPVDNLMGSFDRHTMEGFSADFGLPEVE